WDLSKTDKNRELIEKILSSDPNAEVLHKEDVLNHEFIYLGYKTIDKETEFNTINLILWDGKPYIYMTSSTVVIEKLVRIPLDKLYQSGHLIKIKIVEKLGKSKKKYLDVEVSEI
ncbi:MAG: hypothetical protein ACP5G1_03565, partial [Nanopusillaceae archaeon]